MMKWLLCLLMVADAFVVSPRYFAARSVVVMSVATAESDVMKAFSAVKEAAQAFSETPEREVANRIVDKLAKSHFSDWNPDDMELIDACLLEEDEACEAFCTAMTNLREIYDKSPGNA